MTVQAMFAVEGMTLRDWFAGQALAARVASVSPASAEAQSPAELARWAYSVAQAMLAQREQLYSDEEHAMWGPLFGHPPPGDGGETK
jgi:hypothetical protein